MINDRRGRRYERLMYPPRFIVHVSGEPARLSVGPVSAVQSILVVSFAGMVVTSVATVPDRVESVTNVLAFGGFGLLLILSEREVRIPRWSTWTQVSVLILLLTIFLNIFLFNFDTVTNVLSSSLIAVVFLMCAGLAPYYFDADQFCHTIKTISVLFVFLLTFNALILVLTGSALVSTVHNAIFVYGIIASLWSYNRNGQPRDLCIAVVLAVVMINSVYRAGLVAVLIGTGIFLVGTWWSDRVARAGVLGCLIALPAGLVLILLVSSELPVSFSGRPTIWRATLQRIVEQPVIGHGFGDLEAKIADLIRQLDGSAIYGPHNAFLKWSLVLGVPGGIAYALLMAGAMVRLAFRRATSDTTSALRAMFVASIVIQMFSSVSPLGLRLVSVIQAMLLGWIISPQYDGSR